MAQAADHLKLGTAGELLLRVSQAFVSTKKQLIDSSMSLVYRVGTDIHSTATRFQLIISHFGDANLTKAAFVLYGIFIPTNACGARQER